MEGIQKEMNRMSKMFRENYPKKRLGVPKNRHINIKTQMSA